MKKALAVLQSELFIFLVRTRDSCYNKSLGQTLHKWNEGLKTNDINE